MKYGEGMNHLVRSAAALEQALITGNTVDARCGAVFKPRLRVGSSGRANNPALPKCPICHQIGDLEREREQIDAELKALYERADRYRRRSRALDHRAENRSPGASPVKVIYSGGHRLEVGVSSRFDDAPRTVRLSVPDGTDLTPDNSRRVALALIEHAAYAERTNLNHAKRGG